MFKSALHEIFTRGWGEPASHHKQLVASRNRDYFFGDPSADCARIATGRFGFSLLLHASHPSPKTARNKAVESLDRLSNLVSELIIKGVSKLSISSGTKRVGLCVFSARPPHQKRLFSLAVIRRERLSNKGFP